MCSTMMTVLLLMNSTTLLFVFIKQMKLLRVQCNRMHSKAAVTFGQLQIPAVEQSDGI